MKNYEIFYFHGTSYYYGTSYYFCRSLARLFSLRPRSVSSEQRAASVAPQECARAEGEEREQERQH